MDERPLLQQCREDWGALRETDASSALWQLLNKMLRLIGRLEAALSQANSTLEIPPRPTLNFRTGEVTGMPAMATESSSAPIPGPATKPSESSTARHRLIQMLQSDALTERAAEILWLSTPAIMGFSRSMPSMLPVSLAAISQDSMGLQLTFRWHGQSTETQATPGSPGVVDRDASESSDCPHRFEALSVTARDPATREPSWVAIRCRDCGHVMPAYYRELSEVEEIRATLEAKS